MVLDKMKPPDDITQMSGKLMLARPWSPTWHQVKLWAPGLDSHKITLCSYSLIGKSDCNLMNILYITRILIYRDFDNLQLSKTNRWVSVTLRILLGQAMCKAGLMQPTQSSFASSGFSAVSSIFHIPPPSLFESIGWLFKAQGSQVPQPTYFWISIFGFLQNECDREADWAQGRSDGSNYRN